MFIFFPLMRKKRYKKHGISVREPAAEANSALAQPNGLCSFGVSI
jgi:hypothetical protein